MAILSYEAGMTLDDHGRVNIYAEALNRYYDSFDEGSRWPGNRGHRLERRTTNVYLRRILASGSRVLDCCAGTGAYCFDLARAGHEVVAGDIAMSSVDTLRMHPDAHLLADIRQLDACDLSRYPDESFDVVLVFGAFYNLQKAVDRRRALAETSRVVRPRGYVVIAYLNRWGCFQVSFMKHPELIDDVVDQFQTGVKEVFYRTTPQEVEAACNDVGIETVYHVAADGLAQAYPDKLAALSDDGYERFCTWHLKTCDDPTVLGSSVHGLFVGKKADAASYGEIVAP